MVVSEHTQYAVGAGIALLSALVVAWQVRNTSGDARRHLVYMPVPLVLLAVAYLSMSLDLLVVISPDGQPVYFTRYGAYILSYTFLMSYLGLVAGASRRYRLVPGLSVIGFSMATPIIQLAPSPFSAIGGLMVLGSLTAVFWAFFRPLEAAAQTVPDERRLLFSKLRYLASMAFVMYMIVAATNRAALGLLDAFVGVFTITYIDLVVNIGLVGLVVSSTTAVQMVAADYPSPLAILTARDVVSDGGTDSD